MDISLLRGIFSFNKEQVGYDYYGGSEKMPAISEEMLEAVDKADSAQFSKEEILDPQGWVFLNFLMDPRTGLGRFRDFRISNYNLMINLIDHCKNHTIEEILKLPDVVERSHIYYILHDKFIEQLHKCARVHSNLIYINLKKEDQIYPGCRFMKYAIFPDCNISIMEICGFQNQNTVFTVGNSIVNRSSKTNIGELMLKYEGGGHRNAGTCQIDNSKADKVRDELIKQIISNG